jgi:replicative DNA helicase
VQFYISEADFAHGTNLIFDIAEDKVGETFSSLEEVIKGSFKKLESVAEHEGFVTGVPTGFRDLDRYTAGLQPSDLIILAGRPSTGKTALARELRKYFGRKAKIFSLINIRDSERNYLYFLV